MNDPIIIVAGDFNRKNLSEAVEDFPDIELTRPIATRGNAALNLTATNIHHEIKNIEALDPIMSEDGKKSDHKCLAFSTTLENSDRFKWVHVMAQKKTPEGDEIFDWKIREEKWDDIYEGGNPEKMTEKFTCVIEKIMDEAYPWRKTKHRNTDDPWIDDDVRRNVRKRKKILAKEGRSVKWKEATRRTDLTIQRRKKKQYTKFQEIAKNTCDPAVYYKIVN